MSIWANTSKKQHSISKKEWNKGKCLFIGMVIIMCNYIYSFAGISRSTTCIIAYLIHERALTFSQALTFVRVRRPIVNPNAGF
jgi:hypothetical protein